VLSHLSPGAFAGQQNNRQQMRKKFKHLTNSDRMEIEHGLRHRKSFKKIADGIGKHHSSVAREVLGRRVASDKGAAMRITNRCVARTSCDRIQLCMDKPDCVRRCSTCRMCNSVCPDFVEDVCAKLSRPPYVCNGCPDEPRCVLRKQYYHHNPAHAVYRSLLSESRSGANITEGELLDVDALVTPLVRKGQSLHHIMVNNPDMFSMNEKTLYRYVAAGMLGAKNGDLPRKCMIKPRSRKPLEHKVDTGCRAGRSYADFNAFMEANPDVGVAEMDTVIGRVGGKALMTLMLPRCGFMVAFLRDRNDSHSVREVFEWMYIELGQDTFRAVLPVALTDNGTEFSNPKALEIAPDGTPRTRVFYCDPRATNQKARIERNHEFIRAILPKGTSFDWLTQEKVNLMMSHINSYSRPGLGDRTPLERFEFEFGAETAAKLGIKRVAPNNVILKPELLTR
jgi:IS30 family transposase